MDLKKAKLKRRRVRTSIKVILAVGIPVYLVVLAFFIIGVRLLSNELIYPNISIDGVDMSWLTREEAVSAIDLRSYDARVRSTEVTITLPDGSELNISGEEVKFSHNTRALINAAYSRGRGNGFFTDTVGFLQRMYSVYIQEDPGESYEVRYAFDMELLRARTNVFTDMYNQEFTASVPLVSDDRIVIVKGAGIVSASELEIFDLAFDGLLRSLASGKPVQITYYMPESGVNVGQLSTIWDDIFTPALSATYDPDTKTVSESRHGVVFDFSGAIDLLNATETGMTVSFAIYHTYPEVTKEDIESILFRDLIGECITRIDGTANRLGNIVLASEAVNGVILEPGEEFSFNRTVGRRTSERGYRSAPAYANGQTIQAIGGGICQVSSSIYSSIMDTDIRVVERYPHGRPVAYLPRGRDATVSWGTLDFRFINNTEYPLRIDAEVDGRTLTVRVFGTIDDGVALYLSQEQ